MNRNRTELGWASTARLIQWTFQLVLAFATGATLIPLLDGWQQVLMKVFLILYFITSLIVWADDLRTRGSQGRGNPTSQP